MKLALGILGLCAVSRATEKEGDNPLDWLRTSIPGEPGTDYPILAAVQETSFSCEGLVFGGYYADPEMQCQGYHVCLQDPISPETLYPVSFLCPNGTIFDQEIFTCNWWFNVDCSASTGLYGAAAGAFGSAGGAGGGEAGAAGGQCPAAGPKSEEECAGVVANCWSPGQTDTDCPANGLCCFDGCANTCVDGPKPSPAPKPQTTPRPQTTPAPPRPVPTTPAPTPKPEPVLSEEESGSLAEVVETRPPAPATTPKPEVSTGYVYPVPAIEDQLIITRPPTPPPGLPTLYGAPPPGRKGRSLTGSQGKRIGVRRVRKEDRF